MPYRARQLYKNISIGGPPIGIGVRIGIFVTTFVPGIGVRNIVMGMFVCLFVCLFANYTAELHQILVHMLPVAIAV